MRNPRKSHLPQISKPAKPEKLCACLWQFSFSPCQLGCFHTVLSTKHVGISVRDNQRKHTGSRGRGRQKKNVKDDICWKPPKSEFAQSWPHWLCCPAFGSHFSRMFQGRRNKACSRHKWYNLLQNSLETDSSFNSQVLFNIPFHERQNLILY